MATEQQMDVEASLASADLEAVAVQVKHALDIQDRRYGFPPKTYPWYYVRVSGDVQTD